MPDLLRRITVKPKQGGGRPCSILWLFTGCQVLKVLVLQASDIRVK
ncbi:hypothetical protein H6G96_00780 [Nostoc sp. FACHB-892]|nr:hypothetical protein [Nostoc sp. FACHB-892]MBD2724889.1 hypothetical protein [Nostoc sp. FACHB-892]